MAKRPIESPVRPLDGHMVRRRPRRRIPMLASGLFAVGVAAGYLLGVPGDQAPAPPAASTTTTAAPVGATQRSLEVAEYSWTEQSPPERNPGLWAVHTALEHNGAIYALIVDDINNRLSRALWRTTDGAHWERIPLDLGPDTVATDLDALGADLMISGWDGDRPSLWRSDGHPTSNTIAWKAIPLPTPIFPLGELVRVFSRVTTEVNAAGEIVVVADMQYAIDTAAIPGATDPSGSPIPLDGRPSLAVAGSEIWTSLVQADGEETVSALTVPGSFSTRPVSGRVGTDVVELQAWSMWASPAGSTFSAVTPPPGIDLAPMVMGFDEGFVATVPAWVEKRFGLLVSADGAQWQAAPGAPPVECGNSRPAVSGAGTLLLISKDFDHTCTSVDGEQWEVHPTPQTAVSQNAFVWVTGDNERFLALAVNSHERALLESIDGANWHRVGMTGRVAVATVHLVGNRLLAVARTGGRESVRPWTVFVGEPISD